MGTRRPQPVRSDSVRDYFIDPSRKELGEYFVDEEGREVFRDKQDQPYYFGKVNGQMHKIIICPPYRPTIRSIAMPAAGTSLGHGGYKKGAGIGAS